MWLLLLGWFCAICWDLEDHPPLFHIQDTYHPNAYYLCYKCPRPWYWTDRALQALDRILGKG